MPVTRNLVSLLPGLRRFARSLTGSQASGDAHPPVRPGRKAGRARCRVATAAGALPPVPEGLDAAPATATRPGLILADINLGAGGSGADAVNRILHSFGVPVIFITGYPGKLLAGERPEPAYLIAKPFLPGTLQATAGQALFFHQVRP